MHVRRPASKRRRSGTLVRSKTRDRGGIGLMIAEQRSVGEAVSWRVPLGGTVLLRMLCPIYVLSYQLSNVTACTLGGRNGPG